MKHAQQKGHVVPDNWIFRDEGYSGSLLVRPGLEKIRDLAAEGQLESVFVYAPDRLSRNYAYQVLLIEEFNSHGVEIVFINNPKTDTPEEALMVQNQGMIAEYERALIRERSRRGKKYKAKKGLVNVLSGAPYGYKYIKKTDTCDAYYQINEQEAQIVQSIYRLYTEELMSIAAIRRWLDQEGIPTRKQIAGWDRSVIWGMLRNPVYTGTACYGKTKTAPRQKITRPLRLKGGYSPRCSANKRTPREEWIEIPVPTIISKETFEQAQELLQKNKKTSSRSTKIPTLLQRMLICQECGYAYYRADSRTSRQVIYYYRCLGSDDYRHKGKRVCSCRPIRQDYLDKLVWEKVLELLENPALIKAEIEKRIQETLQTDPVNNRKASLIKDKAKVQKAIDNMLDAYQESLISLEELRSRIPILRKKEITINEELTALETISERHKF